MKDYVKLTLVFLLFFTTINLEINKIAPPTFAYFFSALIIITALAAYRRHESKYARTMFLTIIAVQTLFCLVIPYWVLNKSMALNATWPYFPELLWTMGGLAAWYYIISFIFVPVVVYFYGRRAWCSFICGTGALAETLGDSYRTVGKKAAPVSPAFMFIRWLILILTVAATAAAFYGYSDSSLFNLVFLIIFILFLRTFLMQAINIILMPKLGTRIWCKYFCPQGLLLSILSRAGRFSLVRDQALCAGCGICNRNCSMSIDITNGPPVNRSGECVGCGICVEVCPQKALSMTTGTRPVTGKRGEIEA